MTRPAFLLSAITILLWSLLPVFTVRLDHVPPFLLIGITLLIAGLVGLLRWRDWRVPWKTFAVGVGGIFGNLFFYYYALQNAPVIEANLLSYLYPILMVFLSPLFLPGYSIQLHHLLGAALGLAGAGLIASGGQLHFQAGATLGYLSAVTASFIWACYSLATKWLPAFPSGAVGGFCLTSGLLAMGVWRLQSHSLDLLAPIQPGDWLALLAIGIGPTGLAYFTWDAAMKRGDPRVIGALTYLTPLLSTLLLAFLGWETLSPLTGLALVLIVGGALLASSESFARRRNPGAAPS
jgi:drug/metabolite transporter (DMT)-like permease